MLGSDVHELLAGTANAAFVTTLEGEICFWNAAAEQLFGHTKSDVLNQSCAGILKGKGALGTVVCKHECSVQRCAARTESIPTFDLQIRTRSGERKWVSVKTVVFEDSRLHRRSIVHLCHDISERKKAEAVFSQMVKLSERAISIGECQSKPAPVEILSQQERTILTLFAEAKNSNQIGKDLKITLPTLRTISTLSTGSFVRAIGLKPFFTL